MRTLVFLDYFTPAYRAGGPIRIFEALASAAPPGTIRIVTQNEDWGHPQPLPGVPADRWHPFGNAEVRYCSPTERKPAAIGKILSADGGYESIHLNSLFSRAWTMKLLLMRRSGKARTVRFFISPHGELADSALAIKQGRKKVFLNVGKSLGLFKGLTWIATSEKEVQEIRKHLGTRADIRLAPPPFPRPTERSDAGETKKAGELKLVFFARLSAMKNIGHLIDVLPRVKGLVQFDVYGPVDTEYAAEWSSIFARLKAIEGIRVEQKGGVPSSEAARILGSYHLFVQPSLSENFGYSILEALAAGTPALISDRTPWSSIEAAQAGHAVALGDVAGWAKHLQSFIDMDHAEWTKRSAAARAWIAANDGSGSELFKIYSSAQ